MRIGNRLFPYPVLSDSQPDYVHAAFHAESSVRQLVDAAKLNFELRLECPSLQNLISRSCAQYVIHIECPSTSYREILRGEDPSFRHRIQLDRLRGSVERTAMVVATQNIEGYTSDDFAADFEGLSFAIPRGGIMAHYQMPALKVNHQLTASEPSHSIFIVYKSEYSGDAPPMTVKFSADSIAIGLGEADYQNYLRMSSDPALQPLLNSAIVLPALVYTLDQLQDEETLSDCRGREWFETLSETMRAGGMNLEEVLLASVEDESQPSTLEIAQDLMQYPIRSALCSIAQLENDEDEEA